MVADPEDVEVGDEDYLGILDVTFSSRQVILLEFISQQSGSKFEHSVTIGFQYFVASPC